LEAELENAKINLARKGDFNIHDSFAIFDINRDGLVDAVELRDGLAAIGCHVSLDECDIIVARYDRTGDRRLNQAEFGEALLAHDPHFNAQVARRPSNYVPRPLRPDDCFHPNTQIEHLSMWRTHIRCENAAEMLRQRLNEHPGLNAYEAFNSLDMNCDGSLSAEELRRIIESRGYFVGLKECDQVIKKMDKNRNHRVSFAEFAHETRNKSPVRR
jgi:Ca2+-binding EF-hand superfamily protein